MKDNIDNKLYNVFPDRPHPSAIVKSNIHIELSRMEENKKSTGIMRIVDLRKASIAIVMVILICIVVGKVGGVQAAIQKLFAFIPGVGIIEEENNEILYYMAGGSQNKDNADGTVKLNTIYVTKDFVNVTWQVTFKDESEAIASCKREIEGSQYGDMKLVVGDTIYEKSSGDYGVGSHGAVGNMSFEVSDVNWNLTDVYQIVFQDNTFDFSLQKYESYENTEDIGPTQMLNDISITAIPEWADDGVTIALYNLNYSTFDSIYGYKDLLSERTPYLTMGDITIESVEIWGYGKEVNFDLSGIELTEEMKEAAVFHIPTIEVKKKENKKIKISISKDASQSTYPESVQFSDSTMHIIRAEEAEQEEFGKCLKLTLKFDYDMENLAMQYFSNILVNNDIVGGLSWGYNEDTGYYYLFIADDIAINKIKMISFVELVYTINDEYQIDLGR